MEPKIDFEIEICRICNGALTYHTANIGQKGLNKLISVSAIRKDGLFSENDYTKTNLRLHAKCRKTYTKDSSIATAVKKQDVNYTSVFLETLDAPMQDLHLIDYENQCIFCAEDASEVFMSNQKRRPTDKRVIVNRILKAETRENILKASFVNDDQWSYQVRERIQGVDLVSLNARYHKTCSLKFRSPKRPTSNKRGRPECTQILEQMEEVYKFIESNFNDRQFSIKDIEDALPVDLPSERTIRHKLIEHYGDKLISVPGSKATPSIFCFVSTSHKILHDQYMERHSYPETDRENIVRGAANIILEDIRLRADEAKCLPAPTHFWQDIKHVVPDTLDIFLKIVITNNKQDANDYDRKVTALAHTIVSAARPRSFRSPLLLGISSMIHQKYSSKTLIDLLSSLGFCESHSEVSKFSSSTTSHLPCQHQTRDSTEHLPDNADVKTVIEVVPKEMLELITCKCKKSSCRNCSDVKCCHEFDDTMPFEEAEVIVKKEKSEYDMDPLESLENAPTDSDMKAIKKYEYDDRNEEDLENVCTVNFSKKRRT